MEVAISGKITGPILAHIVPPFATRVSRVMDVGVPGGELGNVQTSGEDRVVQ